MASKSKDAEALTRSQAQLLYGHIQAIESLEHDKKDIQDDITERKTLVTESLPIQKDVLDFVLKRRKHSKGIVNNFDTMLQLVEEAISDVEAEHTEDVRDRIDAAHQRHRPATVSKFVQGPEDEVETPDTLTPPDDETPPWTEEEAAANIAVDDEPEHAY